jgi:hypothetical protein
MIELVAPIVGAAMPGTWSPCDFAKYNVSIMFTSSDIVYTLKCIASDQVQHGIIIG